MTVGITAICQDEGVPKAIIAADRMVTVGNKGGIEYEDTEPKLEPFIDNDDLTAVAVGSGVSAYIDEIQRRTRHYADNNHDLTSKEQAREIALLAYQDTVRETINNQVLSPYGYNLTDLEDPDTSIPTEIQKEMIEGAKQIREDTGEAAQILVAAVGEDGAGLYLLSGMDYTNFSDIGYSVIGSGSGSARLTFIRREYDHGCSYHEGVLTVLEAKHQAEERQGVGRKVDIMAIGPGELEQFGADEKTELKNDLAEIEKGEKQARESIMDSWDSE